MKEDEKYWPTVILVEGKPYVLTKQQTVTKNDPCTLCDLKEKCNADRIPVRFYPLCTSDNRDDGWYFAEDWSAYDKLVMDYVSKW